MVPIKDSEPDLEMTLPQAFPIVNIGGSLRMEVMDTAAFQQAGRETGNPLDGQYIAMLAASAE